MNIKEDHTPVNTMGDGTAIADKDRPLFKKGDKFMGRDVYEVDHDTYCNCKNGKIKYDRWSKYIEDEAKRDQLKKEYQKGRPIIIQSELTKSMTYLRP